MRALTTPEFGGPEAMVLSEVPDPEPRAGEVLVRVAAAGVNRADVLQRQGHYAPPPGESDVPGLEVSGTIEALGDGVEGWSVGDEVCALLSGGGYAELVRVPAGQLLPVPPGVSLINAAAPPDVTCSSPRTFSPARPCSCTEGHPGSGRWPSSSVGRSAPLWP